MCEDGIVTLILFNTIYYYKFKYLFNNFSFNLFNLCPCTLGKVKNKK